MYVHQSFRDVFVYLALVYLMPPLCLLHPPLSPPSPGFAYSMAMHSERNNRHKADAPVAEGAVPAYLLEREATARAKVSGDGVKCVNQVVSGI